jgi:integrase
MLRGRSPAHNLLDLPDDGWGEMLLTHSEPRSGTSWTDDRLARQRRELKHRAPGETRTVPIHPELVTLLRDHLKTYGTGPGGRIFIGPRGGILSDRAYLAVFHKARAAAFTGPEAASLLPAPLRPAACRSLHLAQRWRGAVAGRRLGRAQRPRPAPGLRQVHLRPARRGQAADPRSHEADRHHPLSSMGVQVRR